MELFECKKIFGRQLISRQFRLQFTFSDGGFAFKKNLYAIYDIKNTVSPYFLLAILNSKLFSFVQVNLNSSGQRDDYPAFSLQDYKKFLIPVENDDVQEALTKLVKQILAKTSDGDYVTNLENKAKVTEYESQIDQLVYKLYDLIPEEIKIIEESRK